MHMTKLSASLAVGASTGSTTARLCSPLVQEQWTSDDCGRCDVIVTQNLKDFPEEALEPYSIETLHPDDFLSNHLALAPGLFCSALRKVRARLKNPPYTAEDYLAILTQQGLVATAAELEQFRDLI